MANISAKTEDAYIGQELDSNYHFLNETKDKRTLKQLTNDIKKHLERKQ